MIFAEFVIVIISLPPALIPNFILFQKSKTSPIVETKILVYGIILTNLGLIFFLGSTIFLSVDQVDNSIGFELYRLGSLFIVLGEGFGISTLILQYFKISDTSIILMSSSYVLFVFIALFSYFPNSINVTNDMITVVQHPFTIFEFYLMFIIVIIIMKFRYDSIKAVLQKSEKFRTENFRLGFYLIFLTVLFFFFIVIVIRSVPGSIIPNYRTLFALPVSLLFIQAAINFRKFKFWFITSAELIVIIFAEKESCSELYSKSFTHLEKQEQTKEFLSSYFKALTETTQQINELRQPLEIMAFTDKTILEIEGDSTITFLITSEWNLVTNSIANWLSKEFEKKFSSVLVKQKEKKEFNKEEFQGFDSIIQEIRNYIPI